MLFCIFDRPATTDTICQSKNSVSLLYDPVSELLLGGRARVVSSARIKYETEKKIKEEDVCHESRRYASF